MGAEMYLAYASAPRLAGDPAGMIPEPVLREIARVRIAAVPDAVLDEIVYDMFENVFWLDDVDPADLPTDSAEIDAFQYERARVMLADTLRYVTDFHREVCSVFDRRRDLSLIVTGGMATCDPPTDAYEPIGILDAVGLWDEPVTPAEVAAARARLTGDDAAEVDAFYDRRARIAAAG